MSPEEQKQFTEFCKRMTFEEVKTLALQQITSCKDWDKLKSNLFNLWRMAETASAKEPV